MVKQNENILIIGGPNAGKTHFGGQLYGRLQMRKSFYKILSPPESLVIFKEVLECLNEGKSADHTHVNANEILELELEDQTGKKLLFSFPDYGGEQIRFIVSDRRITKTWKEQIDKSDIWMLFIRPDEVPQLEDIINRGIPDPDTLRKRNNEEPMILSASAFYIELLQMLLFAKKTATQQKMENPKLTVVLSCWDCLEQEALAKKPEAILQEKLPALHSFIASNWKREAFNVIGLSATGKTLSKTDADLEYIKNGPESFGYFVTSDGKMEPDLTLSISTFIGRDT